MEGGQVNILVSGRGRAFYFRHRKVQTSGPQPVNSEPSLLFYGLTRGQYLFRDILFFKSENHGRGGDR